MCRKLVVINKLSLGNRELGWETWSLPKGEILEFTSKQLKEIIRTGKDEVYGLCISDEGEKLVFDKAFFTTNMMNKSHIGNYNPLEECDNMVNLFYVVIGSYKEKSGMTYDLLSSRYERIQVGEEKLTMLFSMGLVSGGATMESGQIIIASMTKSEKDNKYKGDNKAITKQVQQKVITTDTETKG